MSTNRKSTVAWIQKGFNAGHQDILDDMVANETKLHKQASLEETEHEDLSFVEDEASYCSSSTVSSTVRYAESFLQEKKRVQFKVKTLKEARSDKKISFANDAKEEESNDKEEEPINILVFDGGGMKGEVTHSSHSFQLLSII